MIIPRDTLQEIAPEPPPNQGYKPKLITKNVLKIVVPSKVPDTYLIELTSRLAEDAKNGTLKGLGVFTDYGESYSFGLEGSYLNDPASAVLPLKRLENGVMNQLDMEDPPLNR